MLVPLWFERVLIRLYRFISCHLASFIGLPATAYQSRFWIWQFGLASSTDRGFQIHGVIRLTRHIALAWSAQDSLLSTTPHLYETEGLLLKSPAHWCIGACLIEHSRFSVLLETVSYYEYRNRLISFHDRNLVISSTHLKINHGSETSESSIGVIESASRSSSGFQFSYSSSTIMDRAHQHQHQLYSMHSIGITSLSKST